MNDECFFCKSQDTNTVIAENDLAYARWDDFPVSNGHAEVVPKRHISSYFELSDREIKALFVLAKQVKEVIDGKHSPDAYNIGINDGAVAGQTIPHCHIHLIPRYTGDVENPRGGVRHIIPGKGLRQTLWYDSGMKNRGLSPIETSRLILRPITEAYIKDIYANFNEAISTYMYPSVPSDIHETELFVEAETDKNNRGVDLQMVIEDQSGDFLGCVALHNIDTSAPEFGIWLKQASHGNGYGQEAIAALKIWAEDNLEYEYLNYPVDKRNAASRKVAESIGGVASVEYDTETPRGYVLHTIEYRVYPVNKSSAEV